MAEHGDQILFARFEMCLVSYIAVVSFSPTPAPSAFSDGVPLDGCN